MGSVCAIPLIILLSTNQWVYLVITLILIGISVASSAVGAEMLKQADPGSVVIDEVVGMLVTFLFISFAWKRLLVGFFLFRLFDVVKPPPIRWIEHFPNGFGIVFDDVVAGIYANIVLWLLISYAKL